jgi:hypothetical protein
VRAQLASITVTLACLALLTGCAGESRRHTVELTTQNESGVTGTVTLVELDARQSRVEVTVEPAGNPDMPAHIHPGSCESLVPQPKYPLQNVVNGTSTTVVPAGLSELLAGDLAVNLHRSNDDLGTYTACANLP